MPTYSEEVRDLVLDTLWSLWAELGLSGWERRHQDSAVDLEALIVATARLARLDARLTDEALDWCVAHGRIASAVRLKRLTGAADPATQRAVDAFAGVVNANARLNWPGASTPGTFTPTGRSAVPDLARPALIQLRLRALWGVSARAEVLRVMLADGDRFMGISEVAVAAAFGKDAVAEALDNLQRGGLLEEAGARNLRVFRLGRRDDLVGLVGREPNWQRSWPWPLVLPIVVGMLDAADAAEMSPMARAAEIQRRLREWRPALAQLGFVSGTLGTGPSVLVDYERLTLNLLRRWSGVGEPAVVA